MAAKSILLNSPVDMASNSRLGKEAQIWSHILVPKFKSIIHLSPCTCSCSLAQLCLILCDPTDSSPPGFSAYGISQARTQEEVAISSSRRSSRPRDLTHISWVFCLGRRILCHWATGNILLIPNCLKTSFFVDLFKLEPDKEHVAYVVVMI